jgi:hypothetical protein
MNGDSGTLFCGAIPKLHLPPDFIGHDGTFFELPFCSMVHLVVFALSLRHIWFG